MRRKGMWTNPFGSVDEKKKERRDARKRRAWDSPFG